MFKKLHFQSLLTGIIAYLYIGTATAQNFVEANSITGFDNLLQNVTQSAIAFSDVNLDGKPDLLITGNSGGGVKIAKLYINNGSNYDEVSGTPFTGVDNGSVAFSDVNGDGYPDVLISGSTNTSGILIAKLYTNNGINFTEVTGTPFPGMEDGDIAFSDVNGDDKPDVLLVGRNGFVPSDYAKLYTNSGTNFTEVTTPFIGVGSSSCVFGDVNLDGKPDVLIMGSDTDENSPIGAANNITKLYTNSGTNFTEIATPFIASRFGTAAIQDMNADGKPDVIIVGEDQGSGVAKLYTNSGTNFDEVGTAIAGRYYSSTAVGDLNGDGQPDVLVAGTDFGSGATTKLYTNSGLNFMEVTSTPFVNLFNSAVAFKDVNADGKLDVLLTGTNSSNPFSKLYISVSPTNIVSQPQSVTICEGTTHHFTVSATGDNLRYLWSNGATTSGMNTSLAGSYMVTITGNGGVAESGAANLEVSTITTSILSQPLANATVCSGVSQTFSVSAQGTGILTYTWSNGNTSANIAVTATGTYIVTVSGLCGVAVSNGVQLDVIDCTTITGTPTITGTLLEHTNPSFNVYPNPNTGLFTIDASAATQYSIHDYTGQVVVQIGLLSKGSNIINTTLPKGFYLIRTGNNVQKLIVE
jgi:hypothetical protein